MTFSSTLARGRAARRLTVLLALTAAGCEETAGPLVPVGSNEVGVVLASTDRTLTVFSVDAPLERSVVGLGPDGSPVTLAVRGSYAVVPMGSVPAVAVVDLSTRTLVRTVALPEGSGATGAAFLNDSIAIVANPGLNTVSPVNVRRGTRGADIAVGAYPQAAVAVGDTVFVISANLGPDFSPAGPSTVSAITGSPAQVVRTIALSGFNAGAAAADDGTLVVVNAGAFGEANGSVSIVSRATLTETRHVTGFGDFPGAVGVGPDGRIYVGSFGYGIAIYDPAANAFVRSPDDAVEPGDSPSVSGLGFDEKGRLYSLVPECQAPSRVLRLSAAFDVEAEIATGSCPFAIAFTRVEP